MFRCKKYIAFTLAELMVIMTVMTVILAAIAPVFTSRYTNASFDNVWSLVGASEMNDIYADAPVRSMMNQGLIGITPADIEDVRDTYQPYSKLIIRSSSKVGGDKYQKQIEFRYNGDKYGYLYAANKNLLLGGNYDNLSFTYVQSLSNTPYMLIEGSGAVANTAIGRLALNSLTSGSYNTAFGYSTLSSLTTGSYNTAAGVNAGSDLTEDDANVFIGYNSYNVSSGKYNTVIGNNSSSRSSVSNYTTAVGNNINVKGNYNVAIGYGSNAGGTYNTAVGYNALQSPFPDDDSYSGFQYNTAVGYNSCKGVGTSSKYLTCIGGSGVDSNMSTVARNFYNDSNERVLIGRGVSINNQMTAATLEVHNLSGANSKYPYPNNISGAPLLGDSSVIVNGNLIVRGQTYMVGRSPFPMNPSLESNSKYANSISLMGYKLHKEASTEHKPLIGFDGSQYTKRIEDETKHILRESYAAKEHCICAYSCDNDKDYQSGKGFFGKDSYDWSSINKDNFNYISSNIGSRYNYLWGVVNSRCDGSDGSYNVTTTSDVKTIDFDRAHNIVDITNLNPSDDALSLSGSCCPILTKNGERRVYPETSSDVRLKNIEMPFEASLNEISKIKTYNYTFKSDKNKVPHVGVIAQDLKRIFPNSVSKDEKGYYKIRWDEMFYAAINSVKDLYLKVSVLAARIQNDAFRILTLKNENMFLKQRLLDLSKELDELENKR